MPGIKSPGDNKLWYRMRFPYMALQTITRNVLVVDSMKLIGDPYFFRDIRMVRLQRQVNDVQCKYILEFLKPLSKQLGFWLVYEVDDVIRYEDIPPYNHGRKAYENQMFYQNVRNILEACDFLTVTTEGLKLYYVANYGIDPDKVLVMPNYLPRWWVGEAYDDRRIEENYLKNSSKPRVIFPMSSSHFDITNINGGVDDFTEMCKFIRDMHKRYHFMIIGHCPKAIEDLASERKIEILPGSDLLNYPRELSQKNVQAIVAPLLDNTFNNKKSNIKLLEGWSLGIPVIAQDLPCYSPYTDMTFRDNGQLQNQLDGLFKSKKHYMSVVRKCRRIVDYGDGMSPNGWWLEKNLQPWYSLFTLPQKTLTLDLTKKPEVQPAPPLPPLEQSHTMEVSSGDGVVIRL